MLGEAKYNEVLTSGLLLDHYFVLHNIVNKIELVKNRRIQGFINLLEKKGYLEEGIVTEKGLDLLGDFNTEIQFIPSATETTTVQDTFGDWIQGLHQRCQQKMVELTGSKQVRDKIDKKSYPFLPNSIDLGKVLYKVITYYKINDFTRIEKCIMNYIEKCAAANNWFPILQYYIMKNNKSNLVTDCEGSDEDTPQTKSTQKFV